MAVNHCLYNDISSQRRSSASLESRLMPSLILIPLCMTSLGVCGLSGCVWPLWLCMASLVVYDLSGCLWCLWLCLVVYGLSGCVWSL